MPAPRGLAGQSAHFGDQASEIEVPVLPAGRQHTSIAAPDALPAGAVTLTVRFDYDGGGLGRGGRVQLALNGREAATGHVEHTVPFIFSMSGETLDVGIDTCAPVGPYPHHYPFTGDIDHVDIELFDELGSDDHDRLRDAQLHIALVQQ